MNRLAALINDENISVRMPVIGLKAQGAAFAALFLSAFFCSAFNISTNTLFFEILISVLIAIPLIGVFGLYTAINYIRVNGPTKTATRGIIYNVLYLVGNAVIYFFVYVIAKSGISV